jgi:hypothetical protein
MRALPSNRRALGHKRRSRNQQTLGLIVAVLALCWYLG